MFLHPLAGSPLCPIGLIISLMLLLWRFFLTLTLTILGSCLHSIIQAWRSLDGAFSVSHNSLVYCSSSCNVCSPVSAMSTKVCYQYLLSENMVLPHCVEKFAPTFGRLYWLTTWRSLSFFDLDHQVTHLSWKIAQGVLYTPQCLMSFCLSVPLPCFCGAPIESLEHLFFYCPIAQSVLAWLQSLMFSFSPMCPVILCRHALVSALMSCESPLASLSTYLMAVNLFGNPVIIFVFVMSWLAPLP